MTAPLRRAWLVTALAMALASCGPGTGFYPPSDSPSASPPTTPVPSNEPSLLVEASPGRLAGQTDTAWGRIWDSLPAAFPIYPASTPAEEAASGPASAVVAVQGVEAKAVADWMQSKLELATYSTEALTGPFEDGSYVLESIGSAPGCRVQVSVAPLGGLTIVTVRYGAGCPGP